MVCGPVALLHDGIPRNGDFRNLNNFPIIQPLVTITSKVDVFVRISGLFLLESKYATVLDMFKPDCLLKNPVSIVAIS